MAADPFSSPDRDMNEVAELVTWYVIEEELFHPQKDAHWHATIVALCSSTSSKISNRTARLLTLVSLLMKLRSKECPNMKTVVNLLGRMLVFPEWEDHVEMLQNLYDEAKCQIQLLNLIGQKAILMCYMDQQWDKALGLWEEYFNSEQHDSMLADTLHQILKEKGKGSSRTASAFCADHSFSKFKEEVLKFLYSALPQFGHSTLYMNFRKLLASHAETDRTTGTADLTTVAADGNERAAVTTDPATVAGDGTEPATVAGDGTEPAIVAADGMEPAMVTADGPSGEEDVGGMVAEQTGDVVQSDGQHQTSEASDGEEGVNSPEVVANPLKPSKERTSSGDRVDWSSDESSEVHTPPSHLPSTQYVVVRRKDSLVAQPKRRRIATHGPSSRAYWDPEEVQNLIKGVKLYGIGRWMKIRQNFEFAEHRTNVDLKDKWRNLQGRPR